LAAVRNSAAHGKLDEFSDADVTNMIRDIEQFLAIQLANKAFATERKKPRPLKSDVNCDTMSHN